MYHNLPSREEQITVQEKMLGVQGGHIPIAKHKNKTCWFIDKSGHKMYTVALFVYLTTAKRSVTDCVQNEFV